MNPNDPTDDRSGEETTDWPAVQPPAPGKPPTPAPEDAETTQPAPATPRSIHEENTLEAAQFVRQQQHRPAPPPPPGAVQAGWHGSRPAAAAPPAGPPSWNSPPPYPQPQAGGYQQPIAPRAKPGLAGLLAERRWWLIGGAAAIATVLVIALIVATSGDDSASIDATPTSAAQVPAGPTTTVPTPTAATAPPPAPAPPPVPVVAADALPGLLLPADQISQRMNKPGMTAIAEASSLLPGAVTPPNCTGAWGPAYQPTYNGSGYTGVAIQMVAAEPTHKVAQAVIAFPDAGAAKAFYDRQVTDWNACKSSHIRYEFKGDATEVDIGIPAVTGDILSVMLVPTTSPVAGQQCERDMTLRANVIVDVRACSPTVGSAGLSIARAIADNIR